MHKNIIKIDDKEIPINIPESYEEMRWGQYKRLPDRFTMESETQILESLTGKTFEGFWKDFDGVNEYVSIKNQCLIAYLSEIKVKEYKLWDVIEWQGKTFEIDPDIAERSVGRFEEARLYLNMYFKEQARIEKINRSPIQEWRNLNGKRIDGLPEEEINKLIFEEVELIHMDPAFYHDIIESIFKIYFYQKFTGLPFGSKECQEMDIDELLCYDVLKWGDFFLQSTNVLSSGITLKLPPPTTHRKKRRRGILNYLITLGFIRAYSLWLKET